MKQPLLIIIILCGFVTCQTPIPSRPPGYPLITHHKPAIVIESFYDLLCSDSAQNWPILEKLALKYFLRPVNIIIHIFALPYHHNAFFVQVAGETVKGKSEKEYVKFMQVMFSNQNELLTEAVDLTEPQVKARIASLVQASCGVSYEEVLKGFDDPVIKRKAITAWKYAAHRGITGAPQFIINGVHDPNAPDYKYEDWTKLIDGLI